MSESGHRIAWADAVWDPVRGCTRKSAACVNCYAETAAAQNSAPGGWGEGFAEMKDGAAAWTGKIALLEDRLEAPLAIAAPSRIFVNSMSDLFHDDLSDAAIDKVFAVMARAPRHTFLILTKRPKKMQAWASDPGAAARVGAGAWPLPNVWLGVTAEIQKEADRRIPQLLETPAARRFVAAEPLLGPLSLQGAWLSGAARIDWVLGGGESGAAARPTQPDWVRALRDQCSAAGTPFFWNDWGAGAEGDPRLVDGALHDAVPAA